MVRGCRALVVGLSGGTGSGKSALARQITQVAGTLESGAARVVVVDADVLSRQAVAPGSAGLEAVVERFGPQILDEAGALDRAALAAIIFSDERAKADLEAIIHPQVRAGLEATCRAAQPGQVVIYDVPLLVEAGVPKVIDLVIMVDAPVEVRVQRLVSQRGMSEADAWARIARQATREQRREIAHLWWDNPGESPAELRAAAEEIWQQYLRQYV